MTSHERNEASAGFDDDALDRTRTTTGTRDTDRSTEAMSADGDEEKDGQTAASVVLVVDDEPRIVELFSTWLTDLAEVRTAFDGDQALEAMGDEIDAVLLDRRMPGLTGDEVLEEIRDRGYPCRVAMVTAIEPDFDIVEMGFDDYVVKPVPKDELVGTVERLLDLSTYDEMIRAHYALVSKKALLDVEKPPQQRQSSDDYARLERRIERSKERVDGMLGDVEDDEFRTIFRTLPSGSGPDPRGNTVRDVDESSQEESNP